jgi:hypothetical protein
MSPTANLYADGQTVGVEGIQDTPPPWPSA